MVMSWVTASAGRFEFTECSVSPNVLAYAVSLATAACLPASSPLATAWV